MIIKLLEFYKDGYMKESFAFGGTKDSASIDIEKTYPASLQAYLVDTGNDVILIDTGLPIETKDFEEDPKKPIFMGKKVNNFIDALKLTGYNVEDVTKVLLTHKHPDHAGELRVFNHAKIYMSETEAEALHLNAENIVRVKFESGSYKNFEKSQKICDGIYMIEAIGHTNGNSIVIVEKDDKFFMFHGDVTYCDEALIQNHLSIVFENKEKAIQTLENIRTFVNNNDTVYLSTHTPQSIQSLKNNTIIKL